MSQYSDEPIIDVERQRQRVGELLEDPTIFPVEFLSWLKRYIEQSGIMLPATSIIGGFSSGGGKVSNLAAGLIIPFAGGTPPTGALLCDGTSYVRNDYPKLFAEIGEAWGAPDSLTFNVPDLRGRTLFGAFSGLALGQTDASALADRGPLHRHSVAETPHNHTITDPGHAHSISGTGITAPGGANMAVDNVPSNTARGSASATTGITVAAAATGVAVGPAGKTVDAPAYAGILYIITIGG